MLIKVTCEVKSSTLVLVQNKSLEINYLKKIIYDVEKQEMTHPTVLNKKNKKNDHYHTKTKNDNEDRKSKM